MVDEITKRTKAVFYGTIISIAITLEMMVGLDKGRHFTNKRKCRLQSTTLISLLWLISHSNPIPNAQCDSFL